MNRIIRRTLQTAVRSSSPWSLGALNHVAIAVPDLDEATSFYRDVLKVRDLRTNRPEPSGRSVYPE